MKNLTKDAREFVEGVAKYIKTESKSESVSAKVRSVLAKVSENESGENNAVIETAVGLTDAEKLAIRTALEGYFKHPVEVKSMVNPTLLGGLRIVVGDWIFDTTLSGYLKQIQNNLIESL